jgi:hypothetical protein
MQAMKGLHRALPAALIALCLALTLSPLGSVQAQPTFKDQLRAQVNAPRSTIALTVEGGFNSYVKASSWIPVRISLNANEAIEGEIVVSPRPDRSQRFGTSVTLARNSRKVVTLYSPPTAFPIEALFLASGKVIAASVVPIKVLADEDRLIVVVSDPADSFNFLSDLRTPFGGKSYVAQMTPEQVPDHNAGLDSADVLIFDNIDTLTLSEAQRAAIREWVLGGGHLILGGGPGARLTLGGFNDLAPARLGAPLESSALNNLKDLVLPGTVEIAAVISPTETLTPAAFAGPVVVLQPAVDEARSLVNSKDTPLIMRRQLGRGVVDQLAFDPAIAPLPEWADMRMVFNGLFGGRLSVTSILGPIRENQIALTAARALPGAALPPFLVIAVYLLLFVLAIGPINFLILRRFNRLAWAWFTIPCIVVLFALLGYSTGFRLRGNEPQVHRLSIVSGDSQLTDGRALSLVGIFSPRRTPLDIITGHSLAQEIQNEGQPQQEILSFEIGDRNKLSHVIAANTDVRAFYLRGEGQLTRMESKLEYLPGRVISEPARIAGEIHNASNSDYRDCVLIAGKDYQVIGALAANARVRAEVKLFLDRPQLTTLMSPSHVAATGYASSLGMTFGRSANSSVRISSYRSPFDMNGASLAESILNWRNYNNNLTEQAERGLLLSIYNNPDISLGNGISLACWESQDRVGITVDGANYTDRGLRIWRLTTEPFLAQTKTLLPANVFEWSVLSSSSFIALDTNGLDMDPGEHLLSFSPWINTRATGKAEVTIKLGTSVNTSFPALQSSSLWMYDWEALRFTQVITSFTGSDVSAQVVGAYLSPAGELRVRLDVREEQITLTNIQADVRIP